MTWMTWTKRLGINGQKHAGKFVPPNLALDVEQSFVAAARLNPSQRLVQDIGIAELPAGLLSPSPNRANVTDRAALLHQIAEACKRFGGSSVGILIPDVSVRVALLQLESLPDDRRQAETLLLWKMGQFLPFPPEEARLSFQVMRNEAGSVDVLGVAVRLSVLAEYESLTEAINGGPALTLPATVALLPLLPHEPEGQLLLHLSPGSMTAVVIASNHIRYWKTRVLKGDLESDIEEI